MQTRTGIMHSSQSPTVNVVTEWPPGVPNWVPGWAFQAATVHVRRAFPGTIIRSLATTRKARPAIPVRPLFSEWETRETGPKLLAFIRPWWWRGPNQDIIVASGVQQVRPVYGSVTPDTLPSGSIVRPRTRLTATLRVPAYSTDPQQLQATGQQGIGNARRMRGRG